MPGVCNKQQLERQKEMATAVEIQVEVQVEIEKEIQIQKFDPAHIQVEYIPLYFHVDAASFIARNQSKSLMRYCYIDDKQKVPEFASKIGVSKNFEDTFRNQNSPINAYMKPVHALLFMMIHGNVSCMLITIKEAQQIRKQSQWLKENAAWLTTTQHTVLAGKPPLDYKNNLEYQSIIEQIRFFNGELGLLLEEDCNLVWLMHEPKEKLDYFERYLLPHRETQVAHLKQLQSILANRKLIYQTIARKPRENWEQFDWTTLEHNIDQIEIREYLTFASALKRVNQSAWDTDFSIESLEKEMNLSFVALGYLYQYYTKLKSLKPVLNGIDNYLAHKKHQKEPCQYMLDYLDNKTRSEIAEILCVERTLMNPADQSVIEDNNAKLLIRLTHEIFAMPIQFHKSVLTAIMSNQKINEDDLKQYLLICLSMFSENQTSEETQKEYIHLLFENLANHSPKIQQMIGICFANHPLISDQALQVLVRVSQSDPDILNGLFSNHTPLITKPIFETLSSHPQNEQSLVLRASHRYFSMAQVPRLLKEAAVYQIQKKLLMTILCRSDMSPRHFKQLFQYPIFDLMSIHEILNQLMSEEYINILIDNAATPQMLLSIIMHPRLNEVPQTIGHLLKKLIESKQSLTEIQWTQIAEHPLLTPALIKSIIEKCDYPDVFLNLLAGKHQKVLNEESFYQLILNKPTVTSEVLAAVLKIDLNESALNNIVTHPQVNNDILYQLVLKAKSKATLALILGQPRILFENIFAQMIQHALFSEGLIEQFLEKCDYNNLLHQCLTKRHPHPLSDDVLLKLLEKPMLNQEVLSDILNLSSSTPILNAMAQHRSVNKDLLNVLTQKATQLETVKHILSKDNELKLDNSFVVAFSKNPHLDETTKNECLRNVMPDHLKIKHKLHDFESQYNALLNQWSHEIDRLNAKGEGKNAHYNQALEAATRLFEHLTNAKNEFISHQYKATDFETFKTQSKDFSKSCKQQFYEAANELKKHRGIWFRLWPIIRGFLGVLATLSIVPAVVCSLSSKHGYRGIFFKLPNTRAGEHLEQLKNEFHGAQKSLRTL